MSNNEDLEAIGIITKTNNKIDSETRHKLYEIYCQQIVGTLKAPTTAKFCKEEELIITEELTGVYLISGWVDSQNSYGAMIRTYFNKFKIVNENGTFVVKSNAYNMGSKKLAQQVTSYWVYGIIATLLSLVFWYFIISSIL